MELKRGVIAGPESVVRCLAQSGGDLGIVELAHLGPQIRLVPPTEVETGDAILDNLPRGAGIGDDARNSDSRGFQHHQSKRFKPQGWKDQRASLAKILPALLWIAPTRNNGVRVG